MHEIKMKSDENILKLIHYFIVHQGYNPIIIHGNKDEIWLEKMGAKYNIIRIASNYIHNDDQLDFDYNKVDHIVGSIKKKTLLWNVKVLNVFTNVNENLKIDDQIDNIINIKMQQIDDIYQNQLLIAEFPSIIDKTSFEEKGEHLIMKISEEINKKNKKDAKISAEIFKKDIPLVTYILIGINLLVFALMYILGAGSTDNATLVYFGAAFKPFILDGQWFRLITSGFVHIGILHLAFNNYALYLIGPHLENYFGRIKYVIIYFGTILISSLFSLVFLDTQTISAGASGAIFGLLGALLYFGYHHRVFLGNMMSSGIIPLILINLFIGFSMPGINNAAHIGGLISGVMLAMAVGIKYKTSKAEQINAIIITIIFSLFLIYIGFDI